MADFKKAQAIQDTFPFAGQGPASNTDGTLSDYGNVEPVPQGVETNYSTRGKIMPSKIGNTDYIDANTINHGVLAGNG